jgi:hypothetical protein
VFELLALIGLPWWLSVSAVVVSVSIVVGVAMALRDP